jgi:hypothetical protein
MTVIEDEAVLRENVAVIVTFESGAVANARQISAVPFCAFVRLARTHVRPPPATLLTDRVLPLPGTPATKARRSWLPDVVVIGAALTVDPDVFLSPNVVAPMVIGTAAAVKLTAVALALAIVTAVLVGVNVKPDFDGVTV